MVYEIHTASKDHTKDAVRAGAASAFPGWTVEAIKDAGDEWQLRLVKDADGGKPPFLNDNADDDATDNDGGDTEAPDDDGAKPDDDSDAPKDDKDDSKSDKGDEPKGDVVSELKDLMTQLQDVIKQVSDKAGDAVAETEEHRQKLDEAKDALGGDDALPGLDDVPGAPGDAPAPPLPGGAKMPPSGGTGPAKKPPFGGPKTVVPGRPGTPGGGGPGLPTFTNVEVATHPGIDDKGARISLLAAAQSLESDPDFAEYEVIGMVENPDGSYSAKLKKKSE